MAVERVTDGGRRERAVERDEPGYVDRGGPGPVGAIVGVALLALLAIIAFFMLNRQPTGDLPAGALSGAAATVTESASSAAKSVSDSATNAARKAGGAPPQPSPQ